MGVDASYIGLPIISVRLMAGSPFNGVPDQEWSYYFTESNLASNSNIVNIHPLPPPWNGYRCKTYLKNYDNWLVDSSGQGWKGSGITSGSSSEKPVSIEASRVQEILDNRTRLGTKIGSGQDDFFTWQLGENFFKKGKDNPNPTVFAEMNDTNPSLAARGVHWTANIKARPDGINPIFLTPFMNGGLDDKKRGVHWGASMKEALALNQPFEIFYYSSGSIHQPAPEAPTLETRIPGIVSAKEKELFDISKKAYLAIEWGKNTLYHFIALFIQGQSPRLYSIATAESGDNVANLISVFSEFDGRELFNPNKDFLTFSFEPIGFGMLITSDAFGDKYWAVNSNGEEPVWIGAGVVSIYSGNIQAGFALRPVQYLNASFTTSEQEISQYKGDDREPVATTAMKGSGTNQAATSSSGDEDEGLLHAADAERINGKNIITFIEDGSKKDPGAKLNRKIDFSLLAESDSDADQASSGVVGVRYRADVKLTPSNVEQGNGFVVGNGRSPYIWQLRCYLPQKEGSGFTGGDGIDISCNVMSCDLSWNATSFTEFAHTGSFKVLTFPKVGEIDMRTYTNRSIYIEIWGHWMYGVGDEQARKIFTGMTTGSNVEIVAGKEVINFQIMDYMNVLEGVKFVLSPYYDGMKASKAVRDIVRQTGLSDASIFSGSSNISNANDDPSEYGLPFTNPFEQPQFRFKTGSSLKEAVLKIAELDLKTVFFDTEGNFHYDPIPGGIFNNLDTTPVAEFVSSPNDTDDPTLVAWNMVSFGRGINDVYNVIQVNTVDKATGNPIITGVTYNASIFNPKAEGYLGFRKLLIMQDAAIGSVDAANKYLDTYRNRVTKPPITFKFETFGRSDLKPLAIITLDGQKARIMNISMRSDAATPTWWMSFECEWFDAAQQKSDSPAVTNPGGNPDF